MKGLFKGAVLSAFVAMTGFGGYQLMSQSLEVDYAADVMAVNTTLTSTSSCATVVENNATSSPSYTANEQSGSASAAETFTITTGISGAVNGDTAPVGTLVLNNSDSSALNSGHVFMTSLMPAAKLYNTFCAAVTSTEVLVDNGNASGTNADTSVDLSIVPNGQADGTYVVANLVDTKATSASQEIYGNASNGTVFGANVFSAAIFDAGDLKLNGEMVVGGTTNTVSTLPTNVERPKLQLRFVVYNDAGASTTNDMRFTLAGQP